MTVAKTAKTYTLEELKEKAGLALNVPALVEIAKTAPLEDGKINLTQVRDKAYQHVVEQTHDLKDAKKLADSTRALAMLRRQSAEEFEKLVAQEHPREKIKTEEVYKRLFYKTEFLIPDNSILVTREGYGSGYHYLNFKPLSAGFTEQDIQDIIGFCTSILETLFESYDVPTHYLAPLDTRLIRLLNMLTDERRDREKINLDRKNNLLNYLIRLLEEKFGLKVKVCWYCKFASKERRRGNNGLICYRGIQGHPYEDLQEAENSPLLSFDDSCEHWSPKKISEKPSST